MPPTTDPFIDLLTSIFHARIVSKKRVRAWKFTAGGLTVTAECEDDVIVKCDGEKSFLRQHIKTLADDMRQRGEFKYEEIFCER